MQSDRPQIMRIWQNPHFRAPISISGTGQDSQESILPAPHLIGQRAMCRSLFLLGLEFTLLGCGSSNQSIPDTSNTDFFDASTDTGLASPPSPDSGPGDGGVLDGSAGGEETAAGTTFYDPVSTEHITAAFAVVRQYAAGHLASPEVRFLSVKGVPTGAPGATYDLTPLRWVYQFSVCDASIQPCGNGQLFTLTQPGLTVVGPFAGPLSGLSLLETEFRAAVPLDFAQLLAGSAPNQEFCPIRPTALDTEYISLQGGVKSGSGNPLWYWTFQCVNVVNGLLVYRKANGDPIT